MMSADTPPDEAAIDRGELDRRNEYVILLVDMADRSDVARRLLDAAVVDPYLVLTTSNGFRVPRWVAEDAGLLLAAAAPEEDGGDTPVGPLVEPPVDPESPVEPPVDDQGTPSARGRKK